MATTASKVIGMGKEAKGLASFWKGGSKTRDCQDSYKTALY